MAREMVTAITGKVLKMMLAASRDTHPNEFACLLRADSGVITEVLLVPGTVSSQRSAILRLYMMPIDFSVVGSAHSHPSPSSHPSEEDLRFFTQSGSVHIIVAYPYSMDSWSAYSRDGRPLSLKVI